MSAIERKVLTELRAKPFHTRNDIIILLVALDSVIKQHEEQATLLKTALLQLDSLKKRLDFYRYATITVVKDE